MTKVELTKKVSERVAIPPKAAKVVVQTFFDAMSESLEKGERIEIRGFGSFVVRHYAAYKGQNPKTGKGCRRPTQETSLLQSWNGNEKIG